MRLHTVGRSVLSALLVGVALFLSLSLSCFFFSVASAYYKPRDTRLNAERTEGDIIFWKLAESLGGPGLYAVGFCLGTSLSGLAPFYPDAWGFGLYVVGCYWCHLACHPLDLGNFGLYALG